MRVLEVSHLLPLKDVPQVLQAQTLQELTDIHVQHRHCEKQFIGSNRVQCQRLCNRSVLSVIKLTLSFLAVGACCSICHSGGPGSSGSSQLSERAGQVVYTAGGRQTGWRGGRRDDRGADHRGLRLKAAGQGIWRHGVHQQGPDIISLQGRRRKEESVQLIYLLLSDPFVSEQENRSSSVRLL